METDFVEGVMRQISQELNKPYASMQAFTQKLKENWVETKESFVMLDEKSLQQMNLPIILQKKILEKIDQLKGHSGGQARGQHGQGGNTQGKVHNSGGENYDKSMDEEGPNAIHNKLASHLNEIYRDILGPTNFMDTLKIMHSLLQNIVSNPTDPKFRTIKFSNEKIKNTLGKSPFCVHFFKTLRFQQDRSGNLELPTSEQINIHELKKGVTAIEQFGEKIERMRQEAGKASFTSTAGKTNADIAAMGGSSISKDYDTLTELKEKRAAMIKPTVPRRTRVLNADLVEIEKQNLTKSQMNFARELTAEEEQEDPSSFNAEFKKELIKRLTEEPRFSSKARQELERLLNTPVYTETVIRFRLPDGTFIESRFSPIEKIADLRRELEKYFNPGKPWFLYTTPPFQRLELKRLANNTLEELNLVPASIISVGFVED